MSWPARNLVPWNTSNSLSTRRTCSSSCSSARTSFFPWRFIQDPGADCLTGKFNWKYRRKINLFLCTQTHEEYLLSLQCSHWHTAVLVLIWESMVAYHRNLFLRNFYSPHFRHPAVRNHDPPCPPHQPPHCTARKIHFLTGWRILLVHLHNRCLRLMCTCWGFHQCCWIRQNTEICGKSLQHGDGCCFLHWLCNVQTFALVCLDSIWKRNTMGYGNHVVQQM